MGVNELDLPLKKTLIMKCFSSLSQVEVIKFWYWLNTKNYGYKKGKFEIIRKDVSSKNYKTTIFNKRHKRNKR